MNVQVFEPSLEIITYLFSASTGKNIIIISLNFAENTGNLLHFLLLHSEIELKLKSVLSHTFVCLSSIANWTNKWIKAHLLCSDPSVYQVKMY